MNKIGIIVLTMMICLTGCQLAVEGAENITSGDSLVGMFVTNKHLDLFDIESFVKDHADKLGQGNQRVFGRAYEGRIYANIDQEGQVNFDGLDGALYIDTSCIENDVYVDRHYNSDHITDIHTEVLANDLEKAKTISAKIYVKQEPRIKLYPNPVYKTEAGEYYLLSGSGVCTSWKDIEKEEVGLTLSSQSTAKFDDTMNKEKFAVKIHGQAALDADYYELKQMSADDQFIERLIVKSTSIPDIIQINPDCDYIILNTHGENLSGAIEVERRLVDKDDDLEIYFFNGSAFAEFYRIEIDS